MYEISIKIVYTYIFNSFLSYDLYHVTQYDRNIMPI